MRSRLGPLLVLLLASQLASVQDLPIFSDARPTVELSGFSSGVELPSDPLPFEFPMPPAMEVDASDPFKDPEDISREAAADKLSTTKPPPVHGGKKADETKTIKDESTRVDAVVVESTTVAEPITETTTSSEGTRIVEDEFGRDGRERAAEESFRGIHREAVAEKNLNIDFRGIPTELLAPEEVAEQERQEIISKEEDDELQRALKLLPDGHIDSKTLANEDFFAFIEDEEGTVSVTKDEEASAPKKDEKKAEFEKSNKVEATSSPEATTPNPLAPEEHTTKRTPKTTMVPADQFARNPPAPFDQFTFKVGRNFVPKVFFTNSVQMQAKPKADMLIPQLGGATFSPFHHGAAPLIGEPRLVDIEKMDAEEDATEAPAAAAPESTTEPSTATFEPKTGGPKVARAIATTETSVKPAIITTEAIVLTTISPRGESARESVEETMHEIKDAFSKIREMVAGDKGGEQNDNDEDVISTTTPVPTTPSSTTEVSTTPSSTTASSTTTDEPPLKAFAARAFVEREQKNKKDDKKEDKLLTKTEFFDEIHEFSGGPSSPRPTVRLSRVHGFRPTTTTTPSSSTTTTSRPSTTSAPRRKRVRTTRRPIAGPEPTPESALAAAISAHQASTLRKITAGPPKAPALQKEQLPEAFRSLVADLTAEAAIIDEEMKKLEARAKTTPPPSSLGGKLQNEVDQFFEDDTNAADEKLKVSGRAGKQRNVQGGQWDASKRAKIGKIGGHREHLHRTAKIIRTQKRRVPVPSDEDEGKLRLQLDKARISKLPTASLPPRDSDKPPKKKTFNLDSGNAVPVAWSPALTAASLGRTTPKPGAISAITSRPYINLNAHRGSGRTHIQPISTQVGGGFVVRQFIAEDIGQEITERTTLKPRVVRHGRKVAGKRASDRELSKVATEIAERMFPSLKRDANKAPAVTTTAKPTVSVSVKRRTRKPARHTRTPAEKERELRLLEESLRAEEASAGAGAHVVLVRPTIKRQIKAGNRAQALGDRSLETEPITLTGLLPSNPSPAFLVDDPLAEVMRALERDELASSRIDAVHEGHQRHGGGSSFARDPAAFADTPVIVDRDHSRMTVDRDAKHA